MNTTTYYGLKKPEASDYATPDAFNENADAVDQALHDLDTGKAGAINNNAALSGAIADADYLPLYDTSAAAEKKTLWSTIKSTLKAYFDGLYAALSHTHTKSQITDFPTLGTAAAKDIPASGNAGTTQVVMGSDSRLSDSRSAADVYAWAKAAAKPPYTAAEVGADASGVAAAAVSAHNSAADAHGALFATLRMGWKQIQTYDLAGTYTWVAPDINQGNPYMIGVRIIGGGGAGPSMAGKKNNSASTSEALHLLGTGGGSGKLTNRIMSVAPGNSYNIVVGAGGIAVAVSILASDDLITKGALGNNGGASSFDGTVADGGNAGGKDHAVSTTSTGTISAGAPGGQGSNYAANNMVDPPALGIPGGSYYSTGSFAYLKQGANQTLLHDLITGKRLLMCGLGAWLFNKGGTTETKTTAVSAPYSNDNNQLGSTPICAIKVDNGDYVATKSTAPGAGGSCCCVTFNDFSAGVGTSKGADGADGSVTIFTWGDNL